MLFSLVAVPDGEPPDSVGLAERLWLLVSVAEREAELLGVADWLRLLVAVV